MSASAHHPSHASKGDEPVNDGAIIEELCRRVADLRGDVGDLVADEVRRLAPLAAAPEQRRLADAALSRLGGLGELDDLMIDPTVDEVLVNAGRDIWVERGGELVRVGELTGSLEHIIERILAPIGRRLDRSSPVVDARLPDGSRVCAVVPPVGVDGPSLSIRRFAAEVRPLADFTDPVGAELCSEMTERRCNVIVTGATSSGKTSLLASMIGTLPPNERIVVIEDTAELPLAAQHVVRLEARPASPDGPDPIVLADLVRIALRFRPDRLVVGEVRGDEVLGMVQAMNTGHDGSFATCHANSALDAVLRLESLILHAAPTWPLPAIRQQLSRSIDVIVHVGRSRSDGRRRIRSISEVDQHSGDGSAPSLRALAEVRDNGRLVRSADPKRRR